MTSGIEYLYVETHNWGKTVKFWQQLGFRIELDLGRSGRLVHPNGGAAVFVEEVPEDRPLGLQIYLSAPEDRSTPGAPAVVTQGWHDSHWGSRLLSVQDPDGRTLVVQHRP